MDNAVDQSRRRHSTRPRLRIVNAITCWILRTAALRRLADRQVIELRFAGRRSGRQVVLPVMYAQSDDQLYVLVGGPRSKRWWLNFRTPHRVRVLLRGVHRTGTGRVVAVDDAGRREAVAIYAARFPELPAEDDPFVVITLDPVAVNK